MPISWTEIFTIILVNSVFTAVALATLAYLGRSIIDRWFTKSLEKYKAELQVSNSRELEFLRAKISEYSDLRNATFTTLANSHQTTNEYIFPSLEMLWNKILEIRELASKVSFIYDIFTPDEYKLFELDKIVAMVPEVHTPEDEMGDLISRYSLKDIESKRIYISEKLWLLAYVYGSFSGRLFIKIQKSKRVPDWDKNVNGDRDDHIYNILKAAFTVTELQSIIGDYHSIAPSRILGVLESKMLLEMNKIMFGGHFIDLTVEEHKRITDLLRQTID